MGARGGSPVYAGAAKEMLGYFSRQGYECPTHTNPADFALDMITIDLQHDDREAESRDRVKKLTEYWDAHGNTDLPDQRLEKIQEDDEIQAEPQKGSLEIQAAGQEKRPSLAVASRKSFNKASLSTPRAGRPHPQTRAAHNHPSAPVTPRTDKHPTPARPYHRPSLPGHRSCRRAGLVLRASEERLLLRPDTHGLCAGDRCLLFRRNAAECGCLPC